MTIKMSAGVRLTLGDSFNPAPPTDPVQPGATMSKKTVLLVITSDNMLSEDSKAKLIAYAQPVADQLNAELLVLGNGQGAELLVVPGAQATNDQTALETATARVVRKVSDSLQMGQSFGSSVIRAEDLQAEMQPGEAMTAIGFAIDPLESAIDQTVRLIAECQGNQEVRLTSHLDQLLALQLKRAERAD